MNIIDTDDFSEKLRYKGIDLLTKSISITNFSGSQQEKDLTEPANCNGFGRIRHFKLKSSNGWPQNPLPIIPANKHLGLAPSTELEAQIFQNSICNWRCWYCFVDFKLLMGDTRYSTMLNCNQLLDMYLAEKKRPVMIDLSGGQPDLTPEWIPWMMEAIKDRNLESEIFLWSDDNLSNDYFWRYLTSDQISLIQSYKMYSRVCCFKGIDENSFQINTKADGKLFNRQFELFERMQQLNLDLYAYLTLISPMETDFSRAIPNFLDRIQTIDEKFPLRIVPLEIFEFTPMIKREKSIQKKLLDGQKEAIKVWQQEMSTRFTEKQLNTLITDVYDN